MPELDQSNAVIINRLRNVSRIGFLYDTPSDRCRFPDTIPYAPIDRLASAHDSPLRHPIFLLDESGRGISPTFDP
jgi:hypothetical protein